jgi:hypothetical protein
MKILQILRAKAGAFRRTLRIVQSQEFLAIYETASKAEQEKAELFATEGNYENLRIWMRQQSGDYTVHDLRRQAQAAGVVNYSRMDKEELLRALYSESRDTGTD